MSKYFETFPDVFYRFGDNESAVLFNNLTVYVDVIDQVKSSLEYYTKYTIQPQDRPDILSQRLYDTPDYHWTFFLMNDNLRIGGWPLTDHNLTSKIKEKFDHWVLTTENNISNKFFIGERVEGKSSGAIGKVVNRKLDLGQLVISPDNDLEFKVEQFVGGDTLAEQISMTANSISAVREYDAIIHWLDEDGNITDIDPYDQSSSIIGLTPVTMLEKQVELNNQLKEIYILKKDIVEQVVAEFKKLL